MFRIEACSIDKHINEEQIKSRVIGITGDGAFAKGNKPFKTTISKLMGKEIVIRWDLLHLINRAHVEVRDVFDG